MIGSEASLIYSASKLDFKDIVDQAKANAGASKVQLEVHDADRLTSSDEEQFLEDIRMIPPQEWWRKDPSYLRDRQAQPFDSDNHCL